MNKSAGWLELRRVNSSDRRHPGISFGGIIETGKDRMSVCK
jgi:hypothetical protein